MCGPIDKNVIATFDISYQHYNSFFLQFLKYGANRVQNARYFIVQLLDNAIT